MDYNQLENLIRKNTVRESVKLGIIAEIDGCWVRVMFDGFFSGYFNEFDKIKNEAENDYGLIKTEIIGRDMKGKRTFFLHKTIKSWTHWQEWTELQWVDGALLTLKLQQFIHKHNFYLIDPHMNNITFDGCNPVWIDYDSFKHATQRPLNMRKWIRNFWHARNPSSGWCKSIPKDIITDLIYGTDDPMGDSINFLEKYEVDKHKTKWTKYPHLLPESMNIINPKTYSGKYKTFWNLFTMIKGDNVNSVIDIGCSKGNFTELIERHGIKRVVALDIDSGALNNIYTKYKGTDKPITVVYADLMSLYDACGYILSSYDRLKCDVAIAVAVIHHLSFFNNVELLDVAKKISKLGEKYAIVEWIDKRDKYLKNKKNFRPDYNRANFINSFTKYYTGKWFSKMSESGTREMFLFTRGE